MPELGSYGSVRGAAGNSRPYRERRQRQDAPQAQLAGVQKAPRHEVAGSVAPGRATSAMRLACRRRSRW